MKSETALDPQAACGRPRVAVTAPEQPACDAGQSRGECGLEARHGRKRAVPGNCERAPACIRPSLDQRRPGLEQLELVPPSGEHTGYLEALGAGQARVTGRVLERGHRPGDVLRAPRRESCLAEPVSRKRLGDEACAAHRCLGGRVTSDRGPTIVLYTDADDEVGGAEQSLGNLLGALDRKLDVTVMGVRRELVDSLAARRRGGAATCVVTRPRNKRHVRPILAHVRAVARLRPAIFHANLPNPNSCRYGILSALLVPGVRVIAVEQSPLPLADAVQLRGKRLLSRRLAAHVAVGEHAARATEANTGLEPGSVRTIYNGVPEVDVEPVARVADGPVVGGVGRLSHEKGFDVFVRALPLLPGVTAVLVGDGPERAALERSASELGVGDRLVITGWTHDARRYLPSLDVLAVPSRLEGFPLVVPEAMLARIPVVAANVGSVPEAVREGETGVLVAPEDPDALASALRQLLADEPARRALGERGRALALERFTAAAMAGAFEALYAEVAS